MQPVDPSGSVDPGSVDPSDIDPSEVSDAIRKAVGDLVKLTGGSGWPKPTDTTE